MPCEPDTSAPLAACRVHCNVEMGEPFANWVLEIDPGNAVGYVLLQTSMLLVASGTISSQTFNDRGWNRVWTKQPVVAPGLRWMICCSGRALNIIWSFLAENAHWNPAILRVKSFGYGAANNNIYKICLNLCVDHADFRLNLCSHLKSLSSNVWSLISNVLESWIAAMVQATTLHEPHQAGYP
jgi:hypothetical protein